MKRADTKRNEKRYTTDLKRYETRRIINAKGSVHVTSIYEAFGKAPKKITGISRVMVITNKSFKTAYRNAIINGAHHYLNEGRSSKNWIRYDDEGFGFRYHVKSWIINYYSHKEQAVTHFDNIRYQKKQYNNVNFVYYNGKLVKKVEEKDLSETKQSVRKSLVNKYGNIEDIGHEETQENYDRMFKQ